MRALVNDRQLDIAQRMAAYTGEGVRRDQEDLREHPGAPRREALRR